MALISESVLGLVAAQAEGYELTGDEITSLWASAIKYGTGEKS